MISPSLLTPKHEGLNDEVRLFYKGFTTLEMTLFNTWLEGIKTGIGIGFLNQTKNTSTYSFNQINLNYRMAFQISNAWYFRPSVPAGFGMKNYGIKNLLLED